MIQEKRAHKCLNSTIASFDGGMALCHIFKGNGIYESADSTTNITEKDTKFADIT